MSVLIQSTARTLMVLMVDSTDHVTGKTGLTLTITSSKDGAAFASITPTVTERGNGWYSLALTTAHTDTLGDLALHITGTAADPNDMRYSVELESLKPTTAGRKLDVSTGGEAGLDWANIGSPTTAQNLSGTSTKALEPTVAGRTLDVSTGGEAGLDWANIGSPTTAQTLSGTSTKALEPTVAGRTLDVSTGGEAGVDWANVGSPTSTNNMSGTSTKAVEPTVAGRTLDVSAAGEAGIDWANIGSPTTTVGLSGTTVKTATDVETDTQDIQSRLPAVLSGGNMKSDVFAMQAGVQTAASFAADAITAAKVAADVGTEIAAAVAAKVVTTGSQTIGGILGHLAFAIWGKRTGQNGPTLTIFNDAGSPTAEIIQAINVDGSTANTPSTLLNP